MSDVYRYEFDENGVCYRKPDGPFVSHDDYARLQAENARLKAEVERLTNGGDLVFLFLRKKISAPLYAVIKNRWRAAKEGEPSV